MMEPFGLRGKNRIRFCDPVAPCGKSSRRVEGGQGGDSLGELCGKVGTTRPLEPDDFVHQSSAQPNTCGLSWSSTNRANRAVAQFSVASQT